MRKAFFQNVLSVIRKNIVSYVAIMMLIFLSTHIFLVSSYLIEDIYISYDNCFDYCKKYDVAAFAINGIDDIINDLKSIKGTEKVETSHISYGFINLKEGKLDTEIITLSNDFVLPFDIEGRLPHNQNELALLKHFAKYYDLKIGDRVKIENDEYLSEDEFIITALFETTQFSKKIVSTYGTSKITGNMIFCPAFVNKNALNSNYTKDNYVMLRNDKLRGLSRFSSEYKNICENYIDVIDDILDSEYNGNYVIDKWNEEWGYDIVNNYVLSTKSERKTLVPLLFFVAMAILISTILRMIVDQKNEIGIMKANGFTNREILTIFYCYSMSAVIIGIVLANIFATFVTEKLYLLYTSSYLTLKSSHPIFIPRLVFLSFIIQITLTYITTHLSIKSIIKKEILDILNDKKTTSIKIYAYESLNLFKKLPTFIKMIINNMLKDVRRCVGIIFGIAGSVMLLTCGIIINRNIYDGYQYQIKKDFIFDTVLFFNPATNAKDDIEKLLTDKKVDKALMQYSELVLKNPENNPNIFELYIYDDKDDFSKIFKLNTINNKKTKYNGVFIQDSYKKYFKLDERGYIKIRDFNGDYKFVRTNAYFYNYLTTSIAIIDKDNYEDIFDAPSYMNAFLINTTNINRKKLFSDLNDIEGFLFYINYKELVRQAFDISYNFINCVVGTFVFTSILLSFLIVLNLMKVNLMERKSEFLILSINGFTKSEITKYILLDMVLMIAIGNIIGLILGSLTGTFILESLTSDKIAFMNRLSYSALIISLVISIVICTIITKMSIKEINEFKIS